MQVTADRLFLEIFSHDHDFYSQASVWGGFEKMITSTDTALRRGVTERFHSSDEAVRIWCTSLSVVGWIIQTDKATNIKQIMNQGQQARRRSLVYWRPRTWRAGEDEILIKQHLAGVCGCAQLSEINFYCCRLIAIAYIH